MEGARPEIAELLPKGKFFEGLENVYDYQKYLFAIAAGREKLISSVDIEPVLKIATELVDWSNHFHRNFPARSDNKRRKIEFCNSSSF